MGTHDDEVWLHRFDHRFGPFVNVAETQRCKGPPPQRLLNAVENDVAPGAGDDGLANLGRDSSGFGQLLCKENFLEADGSRGAVIGSEAIEKAPVAEGVSAITVAGLLRDHFGDLVGDSIRLRNHGNLVTLGILEDGERPGRFGAPVKRRNVRGGGLRGRRFRRLRLVLEEKKRYRDRCQNRERPTGAAKSRCRLGTLLHHVRHYRRTDSIGGRIQCRRPSAEG